MTTQELEEKLEGQAETPNTEFKQAVEWNVDLFVKDILAITNVRDGGVIIIGVEDGTFVRQGLTDAQIATFSEEKIRDQLAEYADPYVSLRVSFPKDVDGKQYVVIEISQFEELPVICKKDGRDVNRGVIYYRTKSGRPQSAPIRNSFDMRDLVLLATVRNLQKMREVGFTVESPDQQQFTSELEGL